MVSIIYIWATRATLQNQVRFYLVCSIEMNAAKINGVELILAKVPKKTVKFYLRECYILAK